MIATVYQVGDTENGDTKAGPIGTLQLFSWTKKSISKPVKGGELMVFSAQMTCLKKINDQSVLEINGEWYQPGTFETGVLGLYKYYLNETVRPSSL